MTDQNWTNPNASSAEAGVADADGTRRESGRGRSRLVAAAMAAGGMAFLAGGAASAQSGNAPEGYTPASDLADVASMHVQADGSVELVMTDGQSVIVAASDVLVEDGIVYFLDGAVDAALDAAAVTGAGAAGGGGATGILLGAGLLGGVAAAAGGGGGGGSSTPTPTPNVNPPVFTSASSASVDENASGTVYTATATDADGNRLTYSIVSGGDSADFSINSSTGAVTFVGTPDFENPADGNSDNVYEITIRASDGTNTTDQAVTITVADVDEAPVFSSGATATVAENQISAYTAVAADDEGTALSYSLSGTDAALFSIDAATGVVTFRSAPDYEAPADAGGDNVYDIVVSASDGANTATQAVAITVTDQNDNSPVFTSAASFTVDENQTSAFTAIATDADAGATLSYTLSGADAAAFKIDAASGVVTFVNAPDYESPGDQSFSLVVTASDGVNSTDQTVTISVANVDEAPVFTSGTTSSVQENQTTAYTAIATDADLTNPTYSISGGADAGLFNIDATTGAVTFKVAPDFESPGDAGGDNVYDIIVRASDATNNVDQAVAITVTDLNDNSPVFSSAATASVVEGTLTAYDANASDADASDTLAYSLSGTDAGLFNIDSSTGVVTFKVAPDFEAPGDAGGNNIYDIVVTASDGTNTADRSVAITVTDGNENAPVITSPTSASVAENTTAAYTVTATDVDLDTITYSIIGGSDASRFTINASTGAVSFVSAPDHENPDDTGGNNVYDIVVRASDGSNNTDQSVAITVTDVNDSAPVFTSAATASVAENQTSAYDADATDADATSTLSYSLSGTDAALFSINASTGVVSFVAAPDFEAPGDAGADNVYDFVVTASDGANTTDQAVAVTVTDVSENNDLPADQSTTANLALGETFSNQLEVVGDRDWIRVELVAGQRYAISLDGSGADALSDPLVRLYDASGNLIGENDDGGPGLNSLLSYTVPTTGTYYIEVGAWDDSVAGSYTVGLETAAPLEEFTNDEIAEFLQSGYWVGNGGSARNWNATDGSTITVNLVDLTADGQTLARAALALWSDLTGITFAEVGVGGQMVFDDDEEGAFATATTSGGIIQSAAVNVSVDWIDTYGTEINSYSFQTYVHEIGHALGLGHAGPYNGSADYAVDAGYLNDSWQATVMSYFSQTENSYIDASFAFVVSPQIADVLAIQNMYGLAANIRSGNTVYGFNSTAGNAIYDATSFATVTSYTIVDSGGTDTMDYSGSNANQTLDLRAESHSSVQGGRGNVGIARGTVIENAIGGTGADTLIGNSANNSLTGNGGNDTFYASGGTDVYNGNGGTDTVFFSGASGDYSVTVNGSGNTVVTDLRAGTPDGVTELISIETIQYGVSAPSLMDALSGKSVADATSQGLADDAAMSGFADTLLGDLAGVHWGPDGLLALSADAADGQPVMRPLDLSDAVQTKIEGGASVQVMDVLSPDAQDLASKPHDHHDDVMPSLTAEELGQVQAIDGGASVEVMDVLSLKTLDLAEKPVDHHDDVMPSLTVEELGLVQAIDGGADVFGTVLSEDGQAVQEMADLADAGASLTAREWLDFNLPEVSWGLDGLASISEGGEMRGAVPSPQSAGLVDLPVFQPEAMPQDEPGSHQPIDAADGWA